MFTGAMVALVTPFQDGEIDFQTLEELIDFQLNNGIDAIVPVGTTGESPTLSHDEHKQLIERIVEVVDGQVPVIAGAGSNSTAEAIELTAFAKKVGADATLQVTPFHRPFQPGGWTLLVLGPPVAPILTSRCDSRGTDASRLPL